MKHGKTKVSSDYSGRQLDLECLQSISDPVDSFTEVVPSVTFDTPKAVSGTNKLAQRYAVLLTTSMGSDIMGHVDGTLLVDMSTSGNVGSKSIIEYYAKMANMDARNAMLADDSDTDTFGKIPDDERLDDCWIDDVVVDFVERKVSVYATVRSVAGTTSTFMIPTTAGVY